MGITQAHSAVLESIGLDGSSRTELGDMVEGDALRELIAAGFVAVVPSRYGETPTETITRQANDTIVHWYLTPAGATAIGLNPDDMQSALFRSE